MKKRKIMEGPERVVCCTLCLCMAVAVFSSVALVYLTALVYMPAKREIESGLSDLPVMCTTIERIDTDDCDWYSCGEWCLSKSSHCTKIWAQVRKNGTDVLFKGCSNIEDITCQVMDQDFIAEKVCYSDNDCDAANDRFKQKCTDPRHCGNASQPFKCDYKFHRCLSVRQYRNCKLDNVCTNLEHLFLCENGLCQNITSAFDCHYTKSQHPVDCKDKRQCITLNGLYECHDGQCAKIEWPWHCERHCKHVPTDASRNMIILAGDRMLAANCDLATNLKTGTKIWSKEQTPMHNVKNLRHHHGKNQDRLSSQAQGILMASCTEIQVDRNHFEDSSSFNRRWFGFKALDCVNGTIMPRKHLPSTAANYTLIHQIFLRHGMANKLDVDIEKIPYETDITIYNKTKVLVNTESCVNTLQEECTEFYLDRRRDGRNYSSRDRYPCYYTPHHGDFVTSRFSIEYTKYIFLLSFAIPAGLWIFSCSCLFGCSKMLRIEENGQMRIRCRQKKIPRKLQRERGIGTKSGKQFVD